MGLIKGALQRPITILVIVAALFFFGINAVRSIKIDIFPDLNLPVIYVSHPYGGFTPDQMEAYFAKSYVNLLLFVSGVKSIETKNVQGFNTDKSYFLRRYQYGPGRCGGHGVHPTGPRRVSRKAHSPRLFLGSMLLPCLLGSWY